MSPSGADARDFRARVSVNGQAASEPGTVHVDATGTDCGSGPRGPLRAEHDEVATLERADLAVTLRLFDGTTVAFDRGGSLDDLLQVLRASFRARVSKSLRFAPADPRHTFDARVSREGPEGFAAQPAQISVVRLGINFLADSGPCAQLPFGALAEAAFDPGSYEVTLAVEPGPAAPAGAKLTVSKLAARTEEFLELLRQARSASLADTAHCLTALVPTLSAPQQMALAAEMAVGRMVSRERCEALAPGAWRVLWEAAAGADRSAYRDALEELAADPGSLWLGMRPYGGVSAADAGGGPGNTPEADAALGPDRETGDSSLPVVYAAVQLRGPGADRDVMALEVLSERDHATYVYRIAPAPAGLDRGAAGAWLAECRGMGSWDVGRTEYEV